MKTGVKGHGLRDFVQDAFAFLLNVASAVMIVFVNKVLMDTHWGYKFAFATTLCGFHFVASALAMWLAEGTGFVQQSAMPIREMVIFTSVAIFSVASLNLSLLTNSVGFYQISKLMVIPFVCAVERMWIGRHFSWPVLASAALTVAGVAVVTVSDVQVRPLGVIIAASSVVLSGMQQILCAKMQSDLNLLPHQLLSNSAPAQGVILWVAGPYVDLAISGHNILEYTWTASAMWLLALSCFCAILVNVSQFMCLGRFSAVTFQVMGHSKTMLILVFAWLFLGDAISPRKLLGMTTAVAGMISYGICMQRQAAAARRAQVQVIASSSSKEGDEEVQSLLNSLTPKKGSEDRDSEGGGSKEASDGGADKDAVERGSAGDPTSRVSVGGFKPRGAAQAARRLKETDGPR